MESNMLQNPSQMHEQAEIDTRLPFQSVKAAVSLFGEKVDGKKSPSFPKQGIKETELHQLREELVITRHQLKDAESVKAKAVSDLRHAEKVVEQMTRQLEEINLPTQRDDAHDVSGRSNVDDAKHNGSHGEEKHVVWEVQLKVAQEQHLTAVAELEAARKELERLRKELLVSLTEKNNATRQAEEALAVAEFNAKRVEELSTEISGTNESLVLVKLACIEASKERAALLAAQKTEHKGVADQSSAHASDREFTAVHELEAKLAATTEELHVLRGELVVAKGAEEKMAKASVEAVANLDQLKSELERARMLATCANAPSNGCSKDLETASAELEKALQKGASLQAEVKLLQIQLEAMRKELEDLKGREANATAAIVSLTNELTVKKSELVAAVAAEAKANEAIAGLSQTLQQIDAEAKEAKENAESMKEEARTAKLEAEQAREAMNAAEIKLKEALKEAEVAKAAETVARIRFRALFEKTDAARASEVDAKSGITISQDEYDSLKKKMHEAGELADMRLAAAAAQAEAVKAGELEIQQRLQTVNEDIDAMKTATKQALQKAEMGEAAKSAVESEMRRWREKELKLRESEAVSATALGNYLKVEEGDQPTKPQSESLAQVLNITRAADDPAAMHKKKKKALLPSLGGFLGSKKK